MDISGLKSVCGETLGDGDDGDGDGDGDEDLDGDHERGHNGEHGGDDNRYDGEPNLCSWARTKETETSRHYLATGTRVRWRAAVGRGG